MRKGKNDFSVFARPPKAGRLPAGRQGGSGRLKWIFAFVFSPVFILGNLAALGATNEERCEEARAVFKESGVARDAKEGFFGGLHIKPPRSTFPPEMDRVTWWGTFKPFEHWQSPEFEAAWVNPRGEMVERETFRGTHCAMVKTRLDVKDLPQGRLEPGMWRVVVSCSGAVIDNHPFAVVGSPASPVDSGGKGDSGIMIWTDDLNE